MFIFMVSEIICPILQIFSFINYLHTKMFHTDTLNARHHTKNVLTH